ncbi:leucine-rich repeat and IQ domain-containing protein 1 [Seriola lalandi dorsalis]|uniref:leucine-rich repeat and IQ domain-containing protein 1 n=1 Tax=Seriola lalandi dorsalis TaxID=1841481 RepID=UPI000C6F6489|nr:leucine-rich repeat and IQ domain-containing protein 1 [Seriola lalandi dorsalis]
MTDANDLYETIMRELDNVVISDTGDTKEEQESFKVHEETVSDDFPPSLLSYFETSKSRAAVCEKFILEELEDFTASHHTKDMVNLPYELDEELNKQVTCETENKENSSSAETHLLPTPTETKALSAHSVSVCLNSEDETETDEYMECKKYLEVRTLKSSMNEEEIKKSTEYQREHIERQHCEEMTKEEQRRQRERDFQEELKKIMEAEKLHQKELELMEKRAQEKLEQEFLLQQELISNLQKRVEKERKVREEEQRNDEKVKEREKNRKREEETRKKEEEKKMIELKSKKMEEDKSRINEEEIGVKEEGRHSDDKHTRREEEVRITMELEVRMKQEEMRHKGEERKSEETRKAEVEKKRKEEGNSKIEEIKLEEDEKIKKHEERRHSMEGKDMLRMEEEKKTKVMGRQKEEEKYNDVEKEKRLRKEKELDKAHEAEDKEKRQEEVKKHQEKNDMRKREDGRKNTGADKRDIKENVRKNQEENIKSGERTLREEGENNKIKVLDNEKEERLIIMNKLQERRRENNGMKTQNESKSTENTRNSLTSQLEDRATRTSSSPGPLPSESTASPTSSDLNKDTSQTSTHKTRERQDEAVKPSTSSGSLPMCLPEHTEQKRLSWMKDCVPWSKLSLQNRRKQKGCVRSRRGLRRAAGASGLPPLCPHTLLQSTGCRSLEKVTTVTLEDLPGCGLSTLAQCTHLQSLTLRRCGLKSLEGIKQLPQLCYIDLQENDISFVDCENMTSLRVLRLGHNDLTSIHGLSGAENLDLLDLSHNSITRIAGLESMKRLQRLSVDHNQLISTKGLRDVYTLIHLDCSHNHLASVEGLENSALLQTLDLRANSLTEPPTLNNHILLRELHLDDNSISSLQGLAVCWLPLMHQLSVAQNRITHLHSMSDFVSLANLDLRFNCMSELQNVCESLEGCQFLREVHLTGNPFQKESGWRATLQRAAAGLRAVDGQETDAFMSAPAVPQVSSASGDFLTFCQAQLKQSRDLQQQHSRELSNASPHLDAVKSSCRHFAETLKLAVDQRFAHEYGDTTVSAGRTTPEKTLDAFWRGFALRRRLASALAAVTCTDSGEDETFEEVDVDEFVLDEAALERHWTLPLCEDSPSRCHSVSEEPLSLKPLEAFPEPSQHTLPPPPPPPPSWRPKQAWVAGEQVDSTGQRISPEGSNRNKSAASSSVLSGLTARSEKILEEWGFTDSHTAHLMLRRAQKMKSKKQQQKKLRDPSVRLALFRNCSYQRGPVEARNRPAPHNRNYMKASEAELGLRQADKTEQVTQGQADRSDRDSESECFLPEISSDVLNGGRVQLVADPGYTERLHHASGLWANSNLAAQPCKERNYPRRNSLGHARGERPSPNRVTSAPLKKERISFRDNPVQLSGGWGGGKKRDKVYK